MHAPTTHARTHTHTPLNTVYDTVSDVMYLALQVVLRGGGARAVVLELRAKLWTLRRDGCLFWSLAHVALFSIPVWWLQPIADNLTSIVFNVYQSLLSHQGLKAPPFLDRDSQHLGPKERRKEAPTDSVEPGCKDQTKGDTDAASGETAGT